MPHEVLAKMLDVTGRAHLGYSFGALLCKTKGKTGLPLRTPDADGQWNVGTKGVILTGKGELGWGEAERP